MASTATANAHCSSTASSTSPTCCIRPLDDCSFTHSSSSRLKSFTSPSSRCYRSESRKLDSLRDHSDWSRPSSILSSLGHLTNGHKSTSLRFSPEPPTLLAFASSFQTLIDSQAPISSTHSAASELLSVSASAFPPSTLPISALTDLISSTAASFTSVSSDSSFSSVSTSLVENMAGVRTATTTAGLDLLGILAEEVDWDPQQKGSPAQLAVLGQSLQTHQEAKQKLWAGHILGTLGLIEADGSRRNSFSTLTSGLPKHMRDAGDVKTQRTRTISSAQARTTAAIVLTDDPLNTMTLTKRTALFYENLYENLCPGIVPRAYIYPRLGRKSHDQDASFAALALSVSLLGMLGLTLPKTSITQFGESSIESQLNRPFVMPSVPSDRRSKEHQSGTLRTQAVQLIERILLLRFSSPGGGVSFGQAPTLETVVTGFFLSLALYNLDDDSHEGGMPSFTEWKDASFFRFCEAVTLAKILGLDRVDRSGAKGAQGEVSEEVKMWLLLARAEKWWAEQKPGYVCQMDTGRQAERSGSGRKRIKSDADEVALPTKRARTSTLISKPSEPLSFLVKLGFANVRDHLMYHFGDTIDCWTLTCSHTAKCRMSPETAVRIHDSLASFDSSSNLHLSADPILVDLARQALRAKLWISCLDHRLVSTDAQGPLRPDQPLHIALDTLDLLEDLDHLVLRSLPHGDVAMGEAIREALHAVRDCVSRLPDGQFAGEAFSFEQVEASDESESPCGDSPRAEDGAAEAARSTTTITRAAQSVIDNLDHFLTRV